ncbi:MAG TPA: type 4a pilus biogenesis protein PilO [Candidatus Saccharimonadales bacterium]|nr:type 4a pilus biogenesis protein PilO [Candidatus Saccharimonadales bacterium]
MAEQSIQRKSNSLLRQAAVKVFPVLRQERTQTFLILVLTFLSLIIFGIFAINPTIATIIQLRKQLADNKLVYAKLLEKTANLSTLQRQYAELQPDLSLVLAAVPDSHKLPEFIGKVQSLAGKNNVNVVTMQSNPIILTNEPSTKDSSVSFSFTVQGTRENILSFVTAFMSFDRIITIDEISLNTITTTQGIATQAMIQGKAAFKSF